MNGMAVEDDCLVDYPIAWLGLALSFSHATYGMPWQNEREQNTPYISL